MTGTIQSPYSSEQIAVWLQGLMTIAWADGHFDDEEKSLIADFAQSDLTLKLDLDTFEPITPDALATTLGCGTSAAENFLRTAVMVAIADGVYSQPEDTVLQQFSDALGLQREILESLRKTLIQTTHYATAESASSDSLQPRPMTITNGEQGLHPAANVLYPVKDWLDGLEVHDPRVAKFLCKMIPPQCPFERDVVLFGRKVVHIPAMCKLNPLYDQLVGLRFRALSYLADDCGEDVTPYIGG
jgi:tellurite resistance protein